MLRRGLQPSLLHNVLTKKHFFNLLKEVLLKFASILLFFIVCFYVLRDRILIDLFVSLNQPYTKIDKMMIIDIFVSKVYFIGLLIPHLLPE